jgi:tetratricopeptide (TPR) repeat protein
MDPLVRQAMERMEREGAEAAAESETDEPTEAEAAPTYQQRRDQQRADRLEALEDQLRRPIVHARHIIHEVGMGREDRQRLREAYQVLRECQRRLRRAGGSEARHPTVDMLLARLALTEGATGRAETFLEAHGDAPDGFERDYLNAHTLLQRAVPGFSAPGIRLQPAALARSRPEYAPRFFGVTYIDDTPSLEELLEEQAGDGEDSDPAGAETVDQAQSGLTTAGLNPADHAEAHRWASEALALADGLAGSTTGLHQLLAAETVGHSLVLLGRYGDALAAYDFATRIARSDDGSIASDDVAIYLRRLQNAKNQAQRLRDIHRYGEEFVLYREADRLRRSGRWEQARPLFQHVIRVAEQNLAARLHESGQLALTIETQLTEDDASGQAITESPYAAAAKYWIGIAHFHNQDPASAVRHFDSFLRENPTGLYRGRAILAMARAALEGIYDEPQPSEAIRRFEQLDDWINRVSLDQADSDRHRHEGGGIRAGALPHVRGPATQYRIDIWGNRRSSRTAAGMLICRATTPWYLDALKQQSVRYSGFMSFSRGNMDEALHQWEQLLGLDPAVSDGTLVTAPNDLTRLRQAVSVGYFITPATTFRDLSPRQRHFIQLTDF